MKDITILYITLNRNPKEWTEFHLNHLKSAIKGASVISVSRKPMDFGINLIDSEEPKYSNIYRQMLRASKVANTKYVAMAEDDVLYSEEHFREYRPADDAFA